MKKIGIILNPYGEKESAGLGRSIFKLATSIIEQDINNFYYIFIKGNRVAEPIFNSKNYKVVFLPDTFFWLNFGLGKYKREIDVFVFFTPSMPVFCKIKKSILVAHDMGVFELPSRNTKERVKRLIIRFIQRFSFAKANKIVTVSNYTKERFIGFFPNYKNKVSVIYNGFDRIEGIGKAPVDFYTSPYFLFIGVVKGRKNPMRIIQSFEKMRENTTVKTRLVFAGRYDSNGKVCSYANKSKYSEDILFLGYVTDDERIFLYKNAFVLVYPSLFEGFGLPILEAMSCGLPVITSDIGATKEVSGDCALLVDPYDIDSISDAMKTLVENNETRNMFSRKGLIREKDFSWEKAGRQYINKIKKML